MDFAESCLFDNDSSALDQQSQSDAVAVDVREGADHGGAEGGEVEES